MRRLRLQSSRGRASAQTGFTLVELLVVIAVIALLAALSTAAGVAIVRRQTVRATEGLLKSLDRALEEFMAATGGVPPKFLTNNSGDAIQYDRVPGADVFPDDGRNTLAGGGGVAFVVYPPDARGRLPRFPDAAVFLKQAKGYGGVDSVVQSIAPRFLKVTIGEEPGAEPADDIARDATPSVLDSWSDGGWSAPWTRSEEATVLYVHPDNLLAQDLYGRCLNGRPYFMSAGADRAYGTAQKNSGEGDEAFFARMDAAIEDNVYSYEGAKGTHRKNMLERIIVP